MSDFSLYTNIDSVITLNSSKRKLLDKLKLATVRDVLYNFPTKYSTDLAYEKMPSAISKWFSNFVLRIVSLDFLQKIEDPIPKKLRDKYFLPSFRTALIWIHSPLEKNHFEMAKKRFAFEEMFFVQVRNQKNIYHNKINSTFPIELQSVGMEKFIESFPFTPTPSQRTSINTILKDISGSSPMRRLLQGDVGSGKTFVAAVSAYATVTNRPKQSKSAALPFGRLQVAYMAPTEVLAVELFENFIKFFENAGVQVGLVTGSTCRKFPSKINAAEYTSVSKKQLKSWVSNGEIPIVIGTQALIQKSVEFKDLALVIIDEQHRFGTTQRMKLGSKGNNSVPHLLSMSATPIPRTLALTIYGNLNLSLIDTMPRGRKKVITKIISNDDAARVQVYKEVSKRVLQGQQVYVICPRIKESETTASTKSVLNEAQRLSKNEFSDFRVGIMHGKLSKIEKEKIMYQFRTHNIDVLVSTTVVEVGVNVPNATSIIIEGSENFGLAQLHQLRGRVIRSNTQAYCYIFSVSKNAKTLKRLQVLKEAKNGFELAEMDLKIRGAGILSGKKQWGLSDISMESLRNTSLVEYAKKEAENFFNGHYTKQNCLEFDNVLYNDDYKIHFE